MKFDPKHHAIQTALNSARDARGDVSDQTRFGAIRTFGEKLAEAIGDFGNRPRRKTNREVERQQDYLITLFKLGLLGKQEFDDLDIVREIGNKGAHGEEIYQGSRKRTLEAFERLARTVEFAVNSKPSPTFSPSSQSPLRPATSSQQPPPPPRFRETTESPRTIKPAPPLPAENKLKLGESLKKIYRIKEKNQSINGPSISFLSLYLFPVISHAISILFASEIPKESRIETDILNADVEFFIIPVLNWFGTLLTTVVHTVTLPFSEYSQGYAVWIGHLSALAVFWIFWQIRSHSWVGIIPALVAVGLAAVTFVVDRERPGDREFYAIIQQIGFRTYSNTLNFPNQPGNVTFTLTSDGEGLKLDSLSAGNTCSYRVSADGLQGTRVALELDVVEGDCRELTGEVYSNGKVIDFDLYTGNNRRVPMQFRINLSE